MTIWLWRWFVPRWTVVSETWLREHEARDGQRGVEGVSIRWPIKKLLNESAVWNTRRLRRRA